MTFDFQPFLRGELLSMRPVCPDDFPQLFKAASDPLIWEQHESKERYKEEIFKSFFHQGLLAGNMLITINNQNEEVIGASRYSAHNAEKKEIEICWTFLARLYWGGKYNREMKYLMLRHAFRFVERVNFVAGTRNIRSQRALEKIGARRISSAIDHIGREFHVYQMTAADFQKIVKGL